jgi:1-phosphofructokinase family hexose kinase
VIATVTLNTALDRILFLKRFRLGRRIVADRSVTTVGGKGTVVSSLLRQMEAETKAYGFAAGPSGHIMCVLLDNAGVPYEFVEADGDTRINTVLVDTEAGDQTTVIAETLRVNDEHVAKIERIVRENATRVPIWVFDGSLPPGAPPDLWARLIRIVKESGGTALLDSSGDGLREGMKAHPLLVKPNLPELEEISGRSLPSFEHAREAAEALLEEGPEWVVATLGEGGLLAVSREDAYFVPPLEVPVASSSGAGDAVIAGIALGLERSVSMETAIRLGAAVAASAVMQPGTSYCVPADVERFFREIRLEKLD